jgi:hypothetical protein
MWFSTDLYGGFCETLFWGWRGEPLNTTSSLVALLWVVYIFYTADTDIPRIQVLPSSQTTMVRKAFPSSVALGCGVLATSGLCSALYHAFLFETFGRLDTLAMTVGGWVAAGIVAHLLFSGRPLALLSLAGSWLLLYSLALGDSDIDNFMWFLFIPNGLWLLGMPLAIKQSEGVGARQWRRYEFAFVFASMAVVAWTQTERRCQKQPELANSLFWGHSLFHVLAYSAYGLGLLIVRDL